MWTEGNQAVGQPVVVTAGLSLKEGSYQLQIVALSDGHDYVVCIPGHGHASAAVIHAEGCRKCDNQMVNNYRHPPSALQSR